MMNIHYAGAQIVHAQIVHGGVGSMRAGAPKHFSINGAPPLPGQT
jgi:hypothetical protein